LVTKCFSGDGKCRTGAGCGEPSRAIAHIGCLFSDLVDDEQLSLFGRSPDSKNFSAPPEFNRDPATRRSRQAGQRSIAFA
jgi:hypothetical protein